VRVDNTPPSAGFAATQVPDDPELIRAVLRDATSGVAGAQLHYRRAGESEWLSLPTKVVADEARASVDSAAVAPGEYEFLASVQDVAGNSASTTLRTDGEPMRLTFPLRAPVRLHAVVGGGRRQVVPYGTSSFVRGRLVTEGGEPLADREVLVVENFGRGALIRERPTTLETDHRGRFRTKIPAGPSRTVVATFAGSQKYLPLAKRIGSLAVRSRARFRTSREAVPEGGRVAFKGKVAHFGARIPRGGKLIELQVRVGAREWDTVREAFRTDGRGRFKLNYRFGRHYVSNALFRFRVKVQDEGNWPFERSTSAQRKVIVRAR
jgi:hypothetical protein